LRGPQSTYTGVAGSSARRIGNQPVRAVRRFRIPTGDAVAHPIGRMSCSTDATNILSPGKMWVVDEPIGTVEQAQAAADELLATVRAAGHMPALCEDDDPNSPTFGTSLLFDWTAWQRMLADTD
jgi:hypothetical protein